MPRILLRHSAAKSRPAQGRRLTRKRPSMLGKRPADSTVGRSPAQMTAPAELSLPVITADEPSERRPYGRESRRPLARELAGAPKARYSLGRKPERSGPGGLDERGAMNALMNILGYRRVYA